MNVLPITTAEAKPWIMQKHYSRRMCQVSHSFGLYENMQLSGIVAYGMPACQANASLGKFDMLELVRLVVCSEAKNAASILVGRSLQQLQKPIAVVSYADQSVGHIGYVYQATNWLYAGVSRGDVEYVIDGKHIHRKSAYDKFGTGSAQQIRDMGHTVESIRQGDKHRYYYFCGNRRERKEMRKALRYEVQPYPKGETRRYDASAEFATQPLLFEC